MVNPPHDRAQLALGGLLSLLSKALFEDGSFPLLVSPSTAFEKSEERRSAFALGFALRFMAKIPEAEDVRSRISQRLQAEMSAAGTWNYWLRHSSDARQMPFPDDLDSTSVCLHSLSLAHGNFMTGDRFAQYVKLLLSAEVAPAGPYATWPVSPPTRPSWQDVDPVVNAHIAAVLSDQDRALSGLDEYLLKVLKDTSLLSPYYPSRIAFLTALSFADRETFSRLIRLEARLLFSEARNPLERSLLAIALVNAHADPVFLKTIMGICLQDAESGDCSKPYTIFLDRMKGGLPYYAGSKAMTLAVCAGALYALSEAIHVGEQMRPDERMMSLKDSVKRLALARFTGTEPVLAKRAEDAIEDLLENDTLGEKTMFPYFVAVSLDRAHELSDDFFLRACLAHTLGWVAYTLYDNILDKESLPEDLSVANVCLRELTLLFSGLIEPEVAAHSLDRVDGANAWEAAACRMRKDGEWFLFPEKFPDFANEDKIIDRYWGIILAARAVFLALGYSAEGEEVLGFEKYVRHFLMAKQLSEDAHEWEEDLTNGVLTSVNVDVLSRLKTKGFTVSAQAWMTDLQSEMQKLYWFETLERTCSQIFSHVEMAGEVCEDLPEISRPFWRSTVARFGRSARLALEERERAMAFLKSMKL